MKVRIDELFLMESIVLAVLGGRPPLTPVP